jgi:hypothetical protein
MHKGTITHVSHSPGRRRRKMDDGGEEKMSFPFLSRHRSSAVFHQQQSSGRWSDGFTIDECGFFFLFFFTCFIE